MNRDYADGANPVTLKSEFILSLCEQVMNGGLGAKEKSIIDRCTAIVYRDYNANRFTTVYRRAFTEWKYKVG